MKLKIIIVINKIFFLQYYFI